MFKFYFFIIIITLISCNTKIRYIGKTLPATNDKVDVYVSEGSIKQSFEFIGKGYVAGFGAHNPEKIQQKSILIARQKGADAILITDFFIPDNGGTTISQTQRADSVGKSLITTGQAVIAPGSTSAFNILFLKYNN